MPSSDHGPVAIIMAAGKGTRMNSEKPKVLCEVCGKPMIEYVLDALAAGGIKQFVVVVGYEAEQVKQQLAHRENVEFVLQAEQLGTGHAIMVCQPLMKSYDGPVVVVAGDSPMMRTESIALLLEQFQQEPTACLLGTAKKEDPTGLGRIVRDADGNFCGIVEEKDTTAEQKQIQEVNLSTYAFNSSDLFWALDQIQPNNAQGEYYITDCPAVLLKAEKNVRAWPGLHPSETFSINTVEQLAEVEKLISASK